MEFLHWYDEVRRDPIRKKGWGIERGDGGNIPNRRAIQPCDILKRLLNKVLHKMA